MCNIYGRHSGLQLPLSSFIIQQTWGITRSVSRERYQIGMDHALVAITDYCERIDDSFWAEPLNAVTNLVFLFVAAAQIRALRQRGEPVSQTWDLWLLTGLLGAIGIGSFFWHTFATAWAELADVIPILLFLSLFLCSFLHRVTKLRISWVLFWFFSLSSSQYPSVVDVTGGSAQRLYILSACLEWSVVNRPLLQIHHAWLFQPIALRGAGIYPLACISHLGSVAVCGMVLWNPFYLAPVEWRYPLHSDRCVYAETENCSSASWRYGLIKSIGDKLLLNLIHMVNRQGEVAFLLGKL